METLTLGKSKAAQLVESDSPTCRVKREPGMRALIERHSGLANLFVFFFVPCLCRIFSRFRFGPRTPPCFVNFHQATLLCKYAMAFRLIMSHVFSLFFFCLVPGQGLLGRGYGQEFWEFGPLNETLTLFKAQRWKICCPVTIKDWTKHYHNTFKTITTQNQWKSRGRTRVLPCILSCARILLTHPRCGALANNQYCFDLPTPQPRSQALSSHESLGTRLPTPLFMKV